MNLSAIQKLAEELRLLHQARSRLIGHDPISKRNIVQLSIKIRDLKKQHDSALISSKKPSSGSQNDEEPNK